MEKHPTSQLDFDFNDTSPTSSQLPKLTKSVSLTLVHSNLPKSADLKNISDREKILSKIISYANTLPW